MSNTLTQTAVRLDLPRSITLVEPVVERRGRRWGRQPSEEQTAPAASASPGHAGNESPAVSVAGNDGARESEPRTEISSKPPAKGGTTTLGANASPLSPGERTTSQAELIAPQDERTARPGERDRPQRHTSEQMQVQKAPAADDRRRAADATHPAPAAATGAPRASHEKAIPLTPRPPSGAEPAKSGSTQAQQSSAAHAVKPAGFPGAVTEPGRPTESLDRQGLRAAFLKAGVGSDSPAEREYGSDSTVSASNRQAEQDSLTAPVRIVSKPRPRYPAQDLELGLQGDVLVDVEFRYSGTLEVLGVRQGLSPRLNESALEAARKIRFLPARRDGRPVDTQATIRICFQLTR